MASLLPASPFLLFLLLHFLQQSMAEPPTGTIERTIKQQILATILPDQPQSSEIFLTSPSGKYAAYFLRRATAPAAGGFGNDFCFVQVDDTDSGESVWESECAPVSTSNTCALVFDDDGLVVFDGSQEAWSAEANGFHPNTLQLVDLGDMRITDKDGELAWKASDMPRSNQGCGFPGSPGLAMDSPPFAAQIGASGSLPFGLPAPPKEEPEVIEDSGLAPAPIGRDGDLLSYGKPTAATVEGRRPTQSELGLSGQPLVDNTPYDSGSFRGLEVSAVGCALSAVIVAWILT